MIIKASQRGGGKQLGLHLLNAHDNEHINVHEIRGFCSRDVVGAFKEAYATSKGTRCKQFLFSVSFNPPETEQVEIATFEDAISRVEHKNGLADQPRVIVFHEKEGRRHAHAVWSRIDADTMTAKQMSQFKNKCMDVSREMYLENSWKMPKGMMRGHEKDPRNFTLEEWQQSKRAGFHARDLKGIIQDCWAVSDSRGGFSAALEECGLKLAKGDRRGHVIVTHQGEVFSVARYTGQKTKDVRARLGDETELKSVEDTKAQFARELIQRGQSHLKEQAQKEAASLTPLNDKREAMTQLHRRERQRLEDEQKQRWQAETKERSARLNTGIMGLWDRVTGTYGNTKRRNEREAYDALQRDRKQQQELINAQLTERQRLQTLIRENRARSVKERMDIHKTLYDLRQGKLEPGKQAARPNPQRENHRSAKNAFIRANPPQAPPIEKSGKAPENRLTLNADQLAKLRTMRSKGRVRSAPQQQSTAGNKPEASRLDQLRARKTEAPQNRSKAESPESRLDKLRQKTNSPPKDKSGPKLER